MPGGISAGFLLQGRANIVAALTGSLGEIDTSHSVSNPRVRLDGDTAHLDALVEARPYHARACRRR